MKNKQIMCFLAGAMLSQASLAQGMYVGLDSAISHSTELTVNKVSIDDTNNLGVNAFAGYGFMLTPAVTVGLEGEYRYIGDADIEDQSFKAQGLFINARTTFRDPQTPLFSEFLLGVGALDGKFEQDSDTSAAYQAGINVGYQFDSGVSATVGYRYAGAKFDVSDVDYKMNTSGIVLGMRYHF